MPDLPVLSPARVLPNMPLKPHKLVVTGLSSRASRGWIGCGHRRIAAALGRAGRRVLKREGDGATPIGSWCILYALYRPDRVPRPATRLRLEPIIATAGWCDDPRDRNYNRPVPWPYPASAERLWRDDGLYDIVIVLDHNQRPRVRGLGSAIFVHVARPGLAPTEGCIAISRDELLRLLARVRAGDAVMVR